MAQKQKVIIISAMTQAGVIGKGEGMPWSIESEYQQYLDFIRDQTVIMGRRSYQIFGEDLTSKHNIVVSRSQTATSDLMVANSFEEALSKAKSYPEHIFIAGGASIYRLALEVADSMYLSFIKGDYQGDINFPPVDWQHWEEVVRVNHPQFEFVEYSRKER